MREQFKPRHHRSVHEASTAHHLHTTYSTPHRCCCCCCSCCGCCCGGFRSAIVLFINDADELSITTRTTKAKMYLICFVIFLRSSVDIVIFVLYLYLRYRNEVVKILHLLYLFLGFLRFCSCDSVPKFFITHCIWNIYLELLLKMVHVILFKIFIYKILGVHILIL